MKLSKLQRNGLALCVNIPAETIRRLGWMPGDAIQQRVYDDLVVLRNVNRPKITFARTEEEYGDRISN